MRKEDQFNDPCDFLVQLEVRNWGLGDRRPGCSAVPNSLLIMTLCASNSFNRYCFSGLVCELVETYVCVFEFTVCDNMC